MKEDEFPGIKYFGVVLALVISGLFSACRDTHREPPLNAIVMVDFSSSRDSSVIEWYNTTIAQRVISNLGPKDMCTINPIDFGTVTVSSDIARVNFSNNTYSNEYSGLQKDEIERQNHQDSVTSFISRFNTSFDKAWESRKDIKRGTDIFGAFELSQKLLVPGHRNILIILSDMQHYMDKVKWNFEDHLNTPADAEHYLSIAPKIDLSNLEVIVLTGPEKNMTPEKFNAVKGFWEKYLQQCHATLTDYSSCSVSKLETVLKKQNQ